MTGPLPQVLPLNMIDHFYLGGEHILALRAGGPATAAPEIAEPLRRPEEWLAATTERAGEPGVGPSRLLDGTLLRDAIAADPLGWLGSSDAPAGDNGILVKLLDAGQRLPVHVHPDRTFAAAHLHSCYGKTEAWYVLGTTGPDPSVWVGWTHDLDPAELARQIDAQDSDWMLGRMHRITVRPGDGILIPAGTAHAIGAGVFVAEVQEPSDFSILLEWSVTTATRDESHLDLGFSIALSAVEHRALSPSELADLVVHTDPGALSPHVRLLPAAADPFFRLDQLTVPERSAATGEAAIDAGFAVVVVLAGTGVVTGRRGGAAGDDTTEDGRFDVAVQAGQVLAVPFAFGPWTSTGNLRLLVARPGAGWPGTLEPAGAS